MLLKEGRLVGDKQLREYLEVQGYADAAKWMYGHALTHGAWATSALLSMSEVRHVHEIMIGPAWNVAPPPGAMDQERTRSVASPRNSAVLERHATAVVD